MNRIFPIGFLAVLLTSSLCAGRKPLKAYEFTTEEQEHRFSRMSFIKDFERWNKEDTGRVIGDDEVLAIGSSSMRGWRSIKKDLAPVKIIHRGFGGSRMVNVLAYKRFFRRYKAKRILIYEGDNDLGGSYKMDPTKFLEQCKEFVNYVREVSPKTKFYFVSIKPSTARMKKWPVMNEGNRLLREYSAKDKLITYIDIATPMLNDDGNTIRPDMIRKDRVHMTKQGYQLWAKTIKPYLVKN